MIIVSRPKKRLFIVLISLAALLMGGAAYGLWHIMVPGLAALHPALPLVVGLAVLFLALRPFCGDWWDCPGHSGIPYDPVLLFLGVECHQPDLPHCHLPWGDDAHFKDADRAVFYRSEQPFGPAPAHQSACGPSHDSHASLPAAGYLSLQGYTGHP